MPYGKIAQQVPLEEKQNLISQIWTEPFPCPQKSSPNCFTSAVSCLLANNSQIAKNRLIDTHYISTIDVDPMAFVIWVVACRIFGGLSSVKLRVQLPLKNVSNLKKKSFEEAHFKCCH